MSVSLYKTLSFRLFSLLLCIFLIGGLSNNSFAQQKGKQKVKKEQIQKKKKATKESAIREEIQRYIGYEELPARYLSLPYDTNINTNVQGAFVDISFLFILFIPLFFLLGYWNRPLAGSLFMLGAFVLLILSVANSIVIANYIEVLKDKEAIAKFLNTTSFSDAPFDYIVAQLHYTFRVLYTPLEVLFNAISGTSDYITYPLLIVLFIGGFYVLNNRIQQHSLMIRALFIFTYLFSFFWLILTAGIIWYGYLMIALGTIYLVYPFAQEDKTETFKHKGLYYGAVGVIGISFILLFAFRSVSYLQAPNSKYGKLLLFNHSVLDYQLGKTSKGESLDTYFSNSNINPVIDQINSEEESLVYRVGTVFPYFIRKNDRRVLIDNQLSIFDKIFKKFKTQQTIADVLKASKYKYLLVDLNTANIDRTPEKTLQSKFVQLEQFIKDNPRLKLLATDRQIIKRGGTKPMRKVFPNLANQEQIYYPGIFAIYEIN